MVYTGDLKSPDASRAGSSPVTRTKQCLGSLMVKQATHNRLSGSSILSLGTINKQRGNSVGRVPDS